MIRNHKAGRLVPARHLVPRRIVETMKRPQVKQSVCIEHAELLLPDGEQSSHDDVGRPVCLGKRAVVVGAGPSGTLVAIALAELGFSVRVYDQRGWYTEGPLPGKVSSRSFCFMLHRRGVQALEACGIDLPMTLAIPREKVIRFRGTKKYVTEASPWSHSINRTALVHHLVGHAQQRYPGQVAFTFNAKLCGVDLTRRLARFQVGDGEEVEATYDLLVGADGTHSKVRSFMVEQVPGFQYRQLPDNMEYKTATLPALGTTSPGPYFTMYDEQCNAFFVCAQDTGGLTRGVYVLERGGFQSLLTKEDYVEALQAAFPAPFTLQQIEVMAEEFLAAPTCSGSYNTRCSQLCGPHVVLVGDAGHSMWPTLGQGVNAALEDVQVLQDVLLHSGGDLLAVPQLYNDRRHKDVLAVVDLTEKSYGSGNHAVGAYGIMQMAFLQLASKIIPGLVAGPALCAMNSTTLRYAVIKERADRERMAADATRTGLQLVGLAASLWLMHSSAMPQLVVMGLNRLLLWVTTI